MKSLRETWQEAAALFWNQPALWLPVLAADFLAFWSMREQQVLARHWMLYILHGHESVLSSASRFTLADASNSMLMTKLMMVNQPLVWAINLLRIILYAVAMVAIGAMVLSFNDKRGLQCSAALQAIKQSARAIGRLSFLALGGLAMALVSMTWLATWFSPWMAYWFVAEALYVVATGGIAWWLMPRMLALLSAKTAPRSAVAKARWFAIAVSSIAGAVTLFANRVGSLMIVRSAMHTRGALAVNCAGSLLASLPYAFGFIGLASIAFEPAPAFDVQEPDYREE